MTVVYIDHSLAPVPTLEEVCDQIDAYRDQRLAAGYADSETGKTWQCDTRSIAFWTAIAASAGIAVSAGADPMPVFALIPADNSVVELSASDTFGLLNGRVMPWVSATILFARALKDQTLGGNAPTDITVGWP